MKVKPTLDYRDGKFLLNGNESSIDIILFYLNHPEMADFTSRAHREFTRVSREEFEYVDW